MKKILSDIFAQFKVEDTFVSYSVIEQGNINKTYRINGIKNDYILQKINNFVFRDIEGLMSNITRILAHTEKKYPGKMQIKVYPTKSGESFLHSDGEYWRLINFIPSVTYMVSPNKETVYKTGKAFGEFQKDLADFPAEELTETIPGFHNTRRRLEKLFADEKEDKVGRVKEVKDELDYIRSVFDDAVMMIDMQARGELPIRVTHNDTKINNVLFDTETGNPICIIDLDTVMPSLVGNDFGDAVRFACNTVEEDCPDTDKISFDLETFEAFTKGFLSETKNTLTKNEIDTLGRSAFTLTLELAVRFLDDYIVGDEYFKINYPEHNLVRTRAQIALAKDIMAKRTEIERIIHENI